MRRRNLWVVLVVIVGANAVVACSGDAIAGMLDDAAVVMHDAADAIGTSDAQAQAAMAFEASCDQEHVLYAWDTLRPDGSGRAAGERVEYFARFPSIDVDPLSPPSVVAWVCGYESAAPTNPWSIRCPEAECTVEEGPDYPRAACAQGSAQIVGGELRVYCGQRQAAGFTPSPGTTAPEIVPSIDYRHRTVRIILTE